MAERRPLPHWSLHVVAAVLLFVFGLADVWIELLHSRVLAALGVVLVLVSALYLYLASAAGRIRRGQQRPSRGAGGAD